MFFLKHADGRNRRQYPRVLSNNLIAVHADKRLVFNLVNLSENGIQFSSSHDFKKKEILSVAVNLAEISTQILTLSRVVWTRAISYKKLKVYRVGMTFMELGMEDLQVLRQFIYPQLRAA